MEINQLEQIKNLMKNIIRNVKDKIKSVPIQIKILVIILFIIVIALIIISIIKVEESKQKYEIYNGNNLNEAKYPGYKELIDTLQESHPNWTFTLFYTRLDWEEVIANEGHSDARTNPLNLIPDSSQYPEDWKCEIDKDKRFDNGTWLCASDIAISHQMDPRNILNEDNIFQFLELKYIEGAQTVEGIKSLTEDSFLAGDSVAQALIEAGKNANVDAYFITSRLIQEQG